MIKIKNLLFAILFICSYNSFGQWTENSNIEDQFVHTFSFLNDDLGYALMKDVTSVARVSKTMDGGANWTPLNLPTQAGELQDIHFYVEGKGVVVIRHLMNTVVPTMIFRTLDDGQTWEDISPAATAIGVGLGHCQFLNDDIGFLATDRFIYTTTDGGATWNATMFDEYILSMDFLDADHGALGTWDGTFNYSGGMLVTTDGGLSWSNNQLNETNTSIGRVRQLSTNLVIAAAIDTWAANQGNKIYKTTDDGANWTEITIPMAVNGLGLQQLDFKDELNGVAFIGNSTTTKVYETNDGGQNWTEGGIISTMEGLDLQLTPNSGYVSGKTGSFYKRSGTTATKLIPTELNISIFPSPVKSGQNISWTSKESFTSLLIVTQTGETIHQQTLHKNKTTLPPLPAGIYYVQFSNEKGTRTTKLVVE